MKKMLFALVGSALLLTACSKENKLNKVLDGEWDVTQVDGQAPMGFSQVIKFTAGKKGVGDITLTTTVTGIAQPVVATGTYELEEDTKITTMIGTDTSSATVVEYSKTDITLRDTQDNSVVKATKK